MTLFWDTLYSRAWERSVPAEQWFRVTQHFNANSREYIKWMTTFSWFLEVKIQPRGVALISRNNSHQRQITTSAPKLFQFICDREYESLHSRCTNGSWYHLKTIALNHFFQCLCFAQVKYEQNMNKVLRTVRCNPSSSLFPMKVGEISYNNKWPQINEFDQQHRLTMIYKNWIEILHADSRSMPELLRITMSVNGNWEKNEIYHRREQFANKFSR